MLLHRPKRPGLCIFVGVEAQPRTPASGAALPPEAAENIAIIDLGTNTFHLLIIELHDRNTYTVKEKFKLPVKLGEGGINQGEISPPAYRRGMDALEKFGRIIASRGIRATFAFATSAVRSAGNGKQFVAEAYDRTGIQIRVINGNEEAALIYRGVRNGVNLPTGTDSLLLDIGGGSVEFIIADATMPKLLRSLNIGAARLLEQLQPSDPISPKEIKALKERLQRALHPLLQEIKEFGPQVLVGSSGTFETLGAMIAHERGDKFSKSYLNNYAFSPEDFQQLKERILGTTRAEREQLPGMEAVRVDMIQMGVVLIDFLLEELNINQLLVSNYALKEGILFRYLEDERGRARSADNRQLREEAVRTLARKFAYNEAHANQVSMLALSIYDQLAPLHQFGETERELLHYAALLHEIGYHINRSGYHKHGQYIINNSNLRGFSSNELLIMANLVRYHRKSLPNPEHLHYNVLLPENKRLVKQLAGILRLAVNLDKAHRKAILATHISFTDEEVLLAVEGADDLTFEIEAALEKRQLFEKAFGRKLRLEQRGR